MSRAIIENLSPRSVRFTLRNRVWTGVAENREIALERAGYPFERRRRQEIELREAKLKNASVSLAPAEIVILDDVADVAEVLTQRLALESSGLKVEIVT